MVGQQIQLDVKGNIKYYEIYKSPHYENDVTSIRTIYNPAETMSIKYATMLQNVIEAINEIDNDIKLVNKSEFWETGKGNELRTSNIIHHESIYCQYLTKSKLLRCKMCQKHTTIICKCCFVPICKE